MIGDCVCESGGTQSLIIVTGFRGSRNCDRIRSRGDAIIVTGGTLIRGGTINETGRVVETSVAAL